MPGYRAPSGAHDHILVFGTVTLSLLCGVLSDEGMGLSLIGCHGQLRMLTTCTILHVHVIHFRPL
jgi:hypothetical protein